MMSSSDSDNYPSYRAFNPYSNSENAIAEFSVLNNNEIPDKIKDPLEVLHTVTFRYFTGKWL